jgi:hypothetical protein
MRRCALVVSAWGNPKSTFTPFRLFTDEAGGKSFSRPSAFPSTFSDFFPFPLRLWPVVAARRRRWPRRWSRTLRDTRSERA